MVSYPDLVFARDQLVLKQHSKNDEKLKTALESLNLALYVLAVSNGLKVFINKFERILKENGIDPEDIDQDHFIFIQQAFLDPNVESAAQFIELLLPAHQHA